MKQLFDRVGSPVALGNKIGAGGEGEVFHVQSHHGLVAKIYNDNHRPDAQKTAKLAAMADARTERLSKLTAWPLDLLREGRAGPIVGFLMPVLHGYKEMHLLYTPKSRLAEFPEATWEFLVHTAMNTAIVFKPCTKKGM